MTWLLLTALIKVYNEKLNQEKIKTVKFYNTKRVRVFEITEIEQRISLKVFPD